MHRFWDIRIVSIQWPWNSGLRSLKVIENDTIRSGTHDFLLTFHSNHRPISRRLRDKWRLPSKIANFSHSPCRPIYSPRWRVTLRIGYRRMGQKKLEWWGYQMVEKVLRFGHNTGVWQPATQPATLRSKYRAIRVARRRSGKTLKITPKPKFLFGLKKLDFYQSCILGSAVPRKKSPSPNPWVTVRNLVAGS